MLPFFPVISHPNTVVCRNKWELWRDKRHEKEQWYKSWWGCHLIHPDEEEPKDEEESKESSCLFALGKQHCRNSYIFYFSSLKSFDVTNIPKNSKAALPAQWQNNSAWQENQNDHDLVEVWYSAQYHLLQCHPQSNTKSAPPLKKRPPFSHLLPLQIKVTYTLLSVSDIVSASLDMLCCSLSLALVAGARAYPVLT